MSWWAAFKGYWVPPQLLSDPPPAVTDLVAYARRGAWTSRDGLLRGLGITWLWLVALPFTVVCRYVEWVWQRPGRAIPIFVLWKLFVHSSGGWFADNVIRPVLAVAAWALF